MRIRLCLPEVLQRADKETGDGERENQGKRMLKRRGSQVIHRKQEKWSWKLPSQEKRWREWGGGEEYDHRMGKGGKRYDHMKRAGVQTQQTGSWLVREEGDGSYIHYVCELRVKVLLQKATNQWDVTSRVSSYLNIRVRQLEISSNSFTYVYTLASRVHVFSYRVEWDIIRTYISAESPYLQTGSVPSGYLNINLCLTVHKATFMTCVRI